MQGSLIPQAINKCMFDLYWDSATNSPKLADATTLTYTDNSKNSVEYSIPQEIGKPWKFRIGSSYHYGSCDSGQWTSFGLNKNDVPILRDLIENGNPTPLAIGDDTWIQPGTRSTLYDYLDSKYPTPPGADITLPVVDESLDLTNRPAEITAFAAFHIDEIKGSIGPNPKFYIEGHLINNFTTSGSSGAGPYYGTYTPPRLAR